MDEPVGRHKCGYDGPMGWIPSQFRTCRALCLAALAAVWLVNGPLAGAASPVVVSAPSTAPPSPRWPAEWGYRLTATSKGRSLHAQATMQWSQQDDTYLARSTYRLLFFGQRSQTSHGTLGPHGVQPTHYIDHGPKRTRNIDFDWRARQATHQARVISPELLPSTQDRLSVFFELSRRLHHHHGAHRAPITLPVMGFSSVDDWSFQFLGLVSSDEPAGSFDTQHWQHHSQDRRLTVDVWVAPSLQYLPVRIRLSEDNGDVIDQRLSRFE